MQAYKYATFSLAAALVIATFPQWSGMNFAVPADAPPRIPETWDTSYEEETYRTEAEHEAKYRDCTLRMDRDISESGEVLERLIMECDKPRPYDSGYYMGEPVDTETMPPDFAALWDDMRWCSTHAYYTETPAYDWRDARAEIRVGMYCHT